MKRIFKLQSFGRWLRKSKIPDQILYDAIEEMTRGLIDADLGKGVLKKRIPLPGHGKRGGTRTLLATNKKDRWIFLYGFQKSEKENVTDEELEALQTLSFDLLSYSEKQLDKAVAQRELLEVFYEDKA